MKIFLFNIYFHSSFCCWFFFFISFSGIMRCCCNVNIGLVNANFEVGVTGTYIHKYDMILPIKYIDIYTFYIYSTIIPLDFTMNM